MTDASPRPWRVQFGDGIVDAEGNEVMDARRYPKSEADAALIVEAVNWFDTKPGVQEVARVLSDTQAVIDAARALVTDAVCDCDEAYTGRGMHAHDCLWRWADDYDLHALVRALDGEVE